MEITTSGRGKIVGCHFVTGGGTANSLKIAGARNVVTGCIFEDNKTQYSVEVTGSQNQLIGNNFYFSGGVYITGRGNMFNSNMVSGPTQTTGGYFLTLGGGGETAVGNKFDDNGSTPAVGGIIAYGDDLVSSNMFDRWSALIAIRREAAAAAIFGNTFRSVATPYSQSVAGANGITVNGTKVLGPQGTAVGDASGGSTIDASARAAINALLAQLRASGVIAT